MKMALSEFALREKGIYGVLHIVILLLSLFLVVSISVDTFKGIPFYTQTVFMKVQFAVCVLFLLDFILEWFLAKHKVRYFATHFVFLLVAIPYQSIISWAGWTFSEEITYLLRFIPLVRGGYALAIVVGWLTYNKASGLFVTYLTTLLATVYFSSLAFLCYGAWGEYIGYRLWGCLVVGVYGCNDSWFQYYCCDGDGACTVSSAGSIGDDDVSDIYGVCDESGAEEEPEETRVL